MHEYRSGGPTDDDQRGSMIDPIMWRAIALHPSVIAVSVLIRELAGGEDDPDHASRRDAVLRALADAVGVGLLEEADGSIVATEEALFVNQFIDNEFAPTPEGEIAAVREALIEIAQRRARFRWL